MLALVAVEDIEAVLSHESKQSRQIDSYMRRVERLLYSALSAVRMTADMRAMTACEECYMPRRLDPLAVIQDERAQP